MATYVQTNDITDRMFKDLDGLSDKCDEFDDELEDWATVLEVDTDDIETSPVHRRIVKWGVAWVCMSLAEDNTGIPMKKNMQAGFPVDDPYEAKLKYWHKENETRKMLVTREVLEGTADTREEFSLITTEQIRGS